MSYTERREGSTGIKGFFKNAAKILKPLVRRVFDLSILGFVLWLLLISAFVLLILWGYIAFFQPAQNAQIMDHLISLNNGQELRVRYPDFILATDGPSVVEITLYKSQAAPPIDVIISVPANLLAIYDPSANLKVKEYALHFADSNAVVEYQSAQVINLRTTKALFAEEIYIEFRVSGSSISPDVEQVPVRIEGTHRAALRDLDQRQVGERSPLFLLVTAVVSGVGLVYREHMQQRQREREEQKEKEKEAKEEANAFFSQAREALLRQGVDACRFALQAIEQKKLEGYLPSPDLKQLARLIGLANGEVEVRSEEIYQMADVWPDETAASLAYACLHNPKDPVSLRLALRRFPKDKIPDGLAQDAFQEAVAVLGAKRPSQARNWPLLPQASALQPLRENLKNPFPPYPVAERESQWLFAKKVALLWEHSLYERFMNLPKLQEGASLIIIHGDPGSGKTALALALGRYPNETHTLGNYLKGQPTILDIQRAFASQMLAFIKQNPTYLNLFGPSERALFAALLSHSLNRAVVLAEIGRAISERQEQVSAQLAKESQVTSGHEETIVPLRLLSQTVDGNQVTRLSPEMWPRALVTCANLLEFEQIRLVIDATEPLPKDWLEAVILSPQQNWDFARINIFLFLPSSEVERTQAILTPLAEIHPLSWEEPTLEKMLRHRWETANGPIPALDAYFRGGALKALLERAQNNPRRLSQLWNCLPWSSSEKPISKNDVHVATKQCP